LYFHDIFYFVSQNNCFISHPFSAKILLQKYNFSTTIFREVDFLLLLGKQGPEVKNKIKKHKITCGRPQTKH